MKKIIFFFPLVLNVISASEISYEVNSIIGTTQIRYENVYVLGGVNTYNENMYLPFHFGGSLGVNFLRNSELKIQIIMQADQLIINKMNKNLGTPLIPINPESPQKVSISSGAVNLNLPETGDHSEFMLHLKSQTLFKIINFESSGIWLGTGIFLGARIWGMRNLSNYNNYYYDKLVFDYTQMNLGIFSSVLFSQILSEKINLNFYYETLIYFRNFGRQATHQFINDASLLGTYVSPFDLRSIDFNLSIGLEYKL